MADPFRVLGLEASVRARDPGVRAALRMLVQHAAHDGPPADRASYEIERDGGDYVVREDGAEIAREADPGGAVGRLSTRVYGRAIAGADPPGLLTAAAGTHGGRRFLLLADERATLVHLSIALLRDGVAMEGADVVALAGGRAATVAQPFLLLDGAAGTSDAFGDLPLPPPLRIPGAAMHPFHPDEHGFAWRATGGPIDAVLDVAVGEGATLRTTDVPKWEMAQRAGRYATVVRPGAWVAELARLVDGAACVRAELPSVAYARRALDRGLR